MVGICALCLKEKDLISQSHIIPKFFYKQHNLYNDKQKILEFDLHNLPNPSKSLPSPDYDEYIMCQKCDGERISSLETYGKIVFYNDKLSDRLSPNVVWESHGFNESSFHCSNVDYTKYKLFLLSILWRCSISKREFFQEVKLGDKHNEKIRKMIYTNNPDDIDIYPILLGTYIKQQEIGTDLIIQPKKHKKDGQTTYHFLIGGIVYIFLVSSHSCPEIFLNCSINKSNEMRIINIPEGRVMDLIKSFVSTTNSGYKQ